MPCQTLHLLHRNWPPMASIAPSAAWKESKLTKPNPREAPVSGSRMILGVCVICPNALNVS